MKKLMSIAGVAVVGAAVGALTLGLGQPAAETKPKAGGAIVMEGKALERLAFLKGTWSGKVGEDWVEETWSGAHGDSIIGMFRWQVGGKTTMWEMLSIKEDGGKAVLRLRHFDGKFEPWKNEAGAVDAMPASEVSAGRVVFAAGADSKGGLKNVEYKSPKEGVLEITVRFKDEGREAIEMDLKRQ